MTERISRLVKLTLDGKMYPAGKEIEFDRTDLFLPGSKMTVKRIHDFLLAQDNVFFDDQTLARPCALSCGVEADYMHFGSTENSKRLLKDSYCKPIENLSTFEWQHATADYSSILKLGLNGLIDKAEASKEKHISDPEKTDFLDCLKSVADTLIEWAHKCSYQALNTAKTAKNATVKKI